MKLYLKRSLKVLGFSVLTLIALVVLLLSLLIFSTTGLKFAVDKVSPLLSSFIRIEANIEDGNLWSGFSTKGRLIVELPNIITIAADDFKIAYDVPTLISDKHFVVSDLEASYLQVNLHLRDDPNVKKPSSRPFSGHEDPFKLVFPLAIDIQKLDLKNFSYMSDIVDVVIDKASLHLKAHDNYAAIVKGEVNRTIVYLKTADDIEDGAKLPEFDNHAKKRYPLSVSEDKTVLKERIESAQANLEEAQLEEQALMPLDEIKLKSPDEMRSSQYQDPKTFVMVNLPLEVEIDELKIHHGRYFQRAYDTGDIYDVSLQAKWLDTKLEVKELKASHLLGEVSVFGSMDFNDWYYMDFNLVGEGHKNLHTLFNYAGGLYGLEGRAKVVGDISKLKLNALINAPQVLVVEGFIRPLDGDLPLALELNVPSLHYPFIDKNIVEKLAKQKRAEYLDKALDHSIKVQALEKIATASSEKEFLDTDETAQLIATDDSSKEQQTIVSGSELIDPIEAYNQNPKLVASKLKVSVSGALFRTMTAKSEVNLDGMGLEQVKVSLDAIANLTQADIRKLSISGKYQKSPLDFNYKGVLEYLNGFTLAGNLKFDSPNAKGVHEALAGKLNLDGDLLFTYQDSENIFFNIEELKALFNLYGNKSELDIKGVNGNLSEGFDIELFKFEQAKNHLTLHGHLSESSDLNGAFTLNSLKALVPSLDGSISGRLKVLGDYKMPEATLIANSKRVKYTDMAIRNLIVNAKLQPLEEKFAFTVLAGTVRLAQDGPLYRQCSLDLSGEVQNHRLSFACGGASRSFVGANGSFDKEHSFYKGTLSDLVFESTFTDPITLISPVNFNYNLTSGEGLVSAVEISDGKATLNVDKTAITANLIKTKLKLEGFDLNYLNTLSPRTFHMSGKVDLKAALEVINGKPDVKAEIDSPYGLINVPNYHIAYDAFNVKASFNQNQAELKVKTSLSHDDGDLNADIIIHEPLHARRLGGKIDLDDLNLDLFAAAGGVFNQLQGKANIKGSLAGSLDLPLFYGDININGAAEPHFNIGTINSIDMKVSANGDHGVLQGVIKVNEGNLNLNGNLNWSKGANGELSVKAQSLPLFLLGYGEAEVNIDTHATLADALYLRGDITIPKARISVSALDSSAQNPSQDEIYIEYGGADTLIKERRQINAPMDMVIDMTMSMGKDVQLDAMGLRSHIIGGINVHKKRSDKDITASGKISLDNAKAEIYGHRFIINYADTIFKGKIDDPQLSVEAIADPMGIEDDVIAGVHVTGYASDPVIELFSKPAMSQNEILSYLLYGHGLEKNTDDTSGSSSQFLMALGLGTTTGLVNSLTGALGMQGVQFASSGSGDETTIGVQTYITKNIRLSYGYGVFTSLSEFRVRYEFMRKLYAEFISSLDQSIDLIYSFEFD